MQSSKFTFEMINDFRYKNNKTYISMIAMLLFLVLH